MSVTLGFVLRVDQAPASMMPPVHVIAEHPAIDVRPTPSTVQASKHIPGSQWHRNSAGQSMNQPATYNFRGHTITEKIQGSHLDLFF